MKTAIIQAVLAMHKPECKQNPMVYEVWHDGEITLTKGGDLFRRRTLHCIRGGAVDESKWLPGDSLPQKATSASSIFVASHEEACVASDLICRAVSWTDEELKTRPAGSVPARGPSPADFS